MTMLDWTKISDNPVRTDVTVLIANELRNRRRCTFQTAYFGFLSEFVTGRRVLDIGVVEHDISHIESPTWKHRFIKEHAAHVLGVDIIADKIELLKHRGFNVKQVDATSDDDLGERFDRVVIGDVIEHVDNPVRLLQFAGRHVTADGEILVSTPNPFFLHSIWNTLVRGTFVGNVDHVSWVSPAAALEIGRRAGLCLDEYWLVLAGGTYKGIAIRNVLHKLVGDSELLASKFAYIYKHPANLTV
jgi:2-polyprenyl-3-methyl-5-hydroxy-6-metoxy-1,4-benzoquinol methylase